jgi:hypothetical protein
LAILAPFSIADFLSVSINVTGERGRVSDRSEPKNHVL